MNPANPILYPNVSRIPAQNETGEGRKASGENGIKKGEFDQSLDQAMQKMSPDQLKGASSTQALSGAAQGLKFSAHATQRLRERQIQFDPETLAKMNDAITKADAKGVQDTLMITDKAALIVSVPNRTVITAMDRNNLSGNIFTNIDGAVII